MPERAIEGGCSERHFTALVRMSTELLKALVFINGVGAAATLVVLGRAWEANLPGGAALLLPLALFGFGLTFAGCATGWSYFAHEQLALSASQKIGPGQLGPAAAGARRYRRLGLVATFVSIGCAILAFGAAGFAMLWLMTRPG